MNNNHNLSNIDIDLNLPSMTNFGYYSIHEFHSNEDIRSTISDKAFSALHFNIRSLAANFDYFFLMLSDMNYSFSVIGLSETTCKSWNEFLFEYQSPWLLFPVSTIHA